MKYAEVSYASRTALGEKGHGRLKGLKGLTPYEFICKAWASQPERFKINPLQQSPGPNI